MPSKPTLVLASIFVGLAAVLPSLLKAVQVLEKAEAGVAGIFVSLFQKLLTHNGAPIDTEKRQAALYFLRHGYRNSNSTTWSVEKQAKTLFHGVFSAGELEKLFKVAKREVSLGEENDDREPKRYRIDPETMNDHDLPRLDVEIPIVADRHIRAMMKMQNDWDCLEREFDVLDPSYNVHEAQDTLVKCRMLVLRNVFDPGFVKAYKKRLSEFLLGLHTGSINRNGATTNPSYGDGFTNERSPGRWEVLLPESMVHPMLMTNDNILEILLGDNRILGPHAIIDGLGVVTADSGAPRQAWHWDDDYLFGDQDAFETLKGIAGHDLPPTLVTMFTPMLSMTPQHGPTEYCLGSSYLKGMPPNPPVSDPALIEAGSLYDKMMQYEHSPFVPCPKGMARAPLLNMGDVVLFDNQIDHRGGANRSPDLRTMLFVTFSRHWKHDGNIYVNEDYTDNDKYGDFLEHLTRTTPFAVPDDTVELEEKSDKCKRIQSIESIKRLMY